jgi:hypothetical protein
MYKFTVDPGMLSALTRAAVTAAARRRRNASPRVLLVASGGGHWAELFCMRAAREGQDMAHATAQSRYRYQVLGPGFYSALETTRASRWGLLRMVAQVAWVVLRERPNVVITSDSASGMVALWVGKWIGARTLQLDGSASATMW